MYRRSIDEQISTQYFLILTVIEFLFFVSIKGIISFLPFLIYCFSCYTLLDEINNLKSLKFGSFQSRRDLRRIYFMQDGAPCHCTNLVLEWLNEKFADRIISRKQRGAVNVKSKTKESWVESFKIISSFGIAGKACNLCPHQYLK